MYGCVCHFGSVYGGHYTAFSKHLGTNQWNYYDDSSISEHRVPGDSPGDHSSAYVLFYQRAGKLFCCFRTITTYYLLSKLEKNNSCISTCMLFLY